MTVETDLVGKSISGGSQSQVRGGGLRNTVLSVCTDLKLIYKLQQHNF